MPFRILSLLSAILLSISVLGQISITTAIPGKITVCDAPGTFTVTVKNTSASPISGLQLEVDLAIGMKYVTGSVTGNGVTESDISNLNVPVFTLPDLTAGQSITITLDAAAGCGIIPVIEAGSLIENKVTVNFSGGSKSTDTDPYIVESPSLSITKFTNQVYAGDYGDTVVRSITITNGGLGGLKELQFLITPGNDISLIKVDKPNTSQIGGTTTVTLNGADFSTIGNGNSTLDENEKITITETIVVGDCGTNDYETNYELNWGCYSEVCQNPRTTSDIVFPNDIPDLEIITMADKTPCYDASARRQQVFVINSGTGVAREVDLDIFQSTRENTPPLNHFNSYIDDSSIEYKIGENGAISSVTPDSAVDNREYSCLPKNNPDPKAQVILSVPDIQPGDTLILSWDVYVCCPNEVEQTRNTWTLGWSINATYKDRCLNNNFESTPILGMPRWVSQRAGQVPFGPTDLHDGDRGAYSFSNSVINVLPGTVNRYLQYKLTVPNCLTTDLSSINFIGEDGVTAWPSDSVRVDGNDIYISYSYKKKPGSFNTTKSVLNYEVTATCAGSCGGPVPMTLKTYYISDPNCSCRALIDSTVYQPRIHCPGCVKPGAINRGFKIERTSYGLPDNNEDGLPDPGGTLDFSSIRTDRAMYGDTLTGKFTVRVITNSDHPSFEYGYASVKFPSDEVTGISAYVKIYDASTGGWYQCDGVPFTKNGNNYLYDFTPATLQALGCPSLPPGFEFGHNDSILLYPEYKVTKNIGNATKTVITTTRMYLSNIPDPPDTSQQFWCDQYAGSYTLIGYIFTNWLEEAHNITSCDSITIEQSFFLSIGPCCGNFAGGNLFPYEYRTWAKVKEVLVNMPPSYNFVSAEILYDRTKGTGGKDRTRMPVEPQNPDADTLVFNTELLFDAFGGPLIAGDDGFNGVFYITVAPGCAVEPFVTEKIDWIFTFDTTSQFMVGSPTSFVSDRPNDDEVLYVPPQMDISVALAIKQGIFSTTEWDLTVLNNANNSDAHNVWLYIESPTGKMHDHFAIDLNTGDTIYSNANGFYELDVLNRKGKKNIRLVASSDTCVFDSMVVYMGWDCVGYPDNLEEYPCIPKKTTIYIDPQPGELEMEVTQELSTVDLCEEIPYEVKVNSVQLGAVQNLNFQFEIPPGLTVIPNTSELKYTLSDPYDSIPDPDSLGNGIYKWNIAEIDSNGIGAKGFPGIQDTSINSFKIRFKLRTSCEYASGGVVRFSSFGTYSCGDFKTSASVPSIPLRINGAVEPYNALLATLTDSLNLCDEDHSIRIRVLNTGPGTSKSNDHVYIFIPDGLSYRPGSFNPVHNASAMNEPDTATVDGRFRLDWLLPAGVAENDTVLFEFGISEDSLLTCSEYEFEMQSEIKSSLICTLTGDTCKQIDETATSTGKIYLNKPELKLTSFDAQTIGLPPSHEELTVKIVITNEGIAVAAGDSLQVPVFFDKDNDGKYSDGDSLLTILYGVGPIPKNGEVELTGTEIIPAGVGCPLVASVSGLKPYSNCSCTGNELLNKKVTYDAGSDTVVCSGVQTTIGVDPVNGYTYSWSPQTGLSEPNESKTNVVLKNQTLLPDTHVYWLKTERNSFSCESGDSALVIVLPEPVANFNHVNVCLGDVMTFVDASSAPPGSKIVSYNWELGDGDNSKNKDVVHHYDTAGTYLVELQISTDMGCPDTVQKYVLVYPVPEVDFDISGSGCLPLDVNITNNTEEGSSRVIRWIWMVDELPVSKEMNPEIVLDKEGPVGVTLIAITDKGCSDTLRKDSVVAAYPNPVAGFEFDPEKISELDPTVIFTDLSKGAIKWEWDFGDGDSSLIQDPEHVYDSVGQYTIWQYVTTEFGCRDSISRTLIVEPEFAIYVPNVFSPNADGANEGFIGQGIGIVEHRMWVYDRWGLMIYKTDNTKQGRVIPWNGRKEGSGEVAQEDVYVYVVEVVDVFGRKHRFIGHVTLLR